MVATPDDEELIIHGLLNDNWNTDNVAKPTLYYKDDMGSLDARSVTVKIYLISKIETPHGLGYTSKETRTRLTADIRGSNRDNVIRTRDECVRILDSKRVDPNADYDLLTHDGGVKQAGYKGFYHYTIDCFMKQTRKTIS